MLASNTILQNRYQIIRPIGKGGMGAVYLAKDQRLGNTVALKQTFFDDDMLLRAFEREARLLASLRHPALPRVSDHFSEESGQFLVMEFIPGADLGERLQNRGSAFPPHEVLAWADQLLDALDYLHSQEPPIIHRDIKPQNLKLTERNQIILLDFGLAKGQPSAHGTLATGNRSIFGYTPDYAPLEQIKAEGTSARSDLYSLAATLYHLMTGVTPPGALARVSAIASGQPDPLRPAHELNPQIPQAVSSVLAWAMAQNINQRPASAQVMREALRDAARSAASGSASRVGGAPPTVISPGPLHTAPPPGPTAPQGQQQTWPTAPPPAQSSWPPPPPPAQPNWPGQHQQARSSWPNAQPHGQSSWPGQQPAQPSWPPAGPPMQHAPYPQPARKSNAAWWVMGGVAALVFAGIFVVVIAALLSSEQNVSNSNIAAANANRGIDSANRSVIPPVGNRSGPIDSLSGTNPPNLASGEASVDQVLEKYVEAIGGREALQSVTSRVIKGSFEMTDLNLTGTTEAYAKAPNKFLLVINLPGVGVTRNGFDGSVGWSEDPQRGLRKLSGAELEELKRNAQFYRDLDLKRDYSSMTLVGKEKILGRDTNVIQGTLPDGSTEKMYFDAQTGLLLRTDSQKPGLTTQQYFEEYKVIDGIHIPITLRQSATGLNFVIKLRDIQHNVTINDSIFSMPSKY
ncbi:MAG TPA: protein kinase [Blastocatellia bacterium]|nr:protein kinase [Blastocatellia bacterium]